MCSIPFLDMFDVTILWVKKAIFDISSLFARTHSLDIHPSALKNRVSRSDVGGGSGVRHILWFKEKNILLMYC
jgi:hypothetical protein